jgi:arginine deiminase
MDSNFKTLFAENEQVNEPALPNWMGSCHPNGSLYEKPLDLRAAQREHERFREELRNHGCIVHTVREILAQDCDVDVMAREHLEELAMGSMTYVLAKTASGAADDDLTSTERQLLSPEYKKSCIEKMDVEQLVEVVLTRPTIVLEKADKDTELLVVNYSYEPLVNLLFCRDQQITTAKGVIMGRPRSRIRQQEVEVMEFCFNKLGVPVIGTRKRMQIGQFCVSYCTLESITNKFFFVIFKKKKPKKTTPTLSNLTLSLSQPSNLTFLF